MRSCPSAGCRKSACPILVGSARRAVAGLERRQSEALAPRGQTVPAYDGFGPESGPFLATSVDRDNTQRLPRKDALVVYADGAHCEKHTIVFLVVEAAPAAASAV